MKIKTQENRKSKIAHHIKCLETHKHLRNWLPLLYLGSPSAERIKLARDLRPLLYKGQRLLTERETTEVSVSTWLKFSYLVLTAPAYISFSPISVRFVCELLHA